MNGWLNLYKPKGITSAGLVGRVKRILGKVKIGHTGTLDPLAEGILPLALGEATKLADLLVDKPKTYQFTMQFGRQTTTSDAEGEVIATTDKLVSVEELVKITPKFIGNISQIPSIYSAIKIAGERAYKLARQGQEVAIPPRIIEIYDLKLDKFDSILQQATFTCHCSKGTYIRTLAEDIALSLQNLAFVIELRRLAVGKFNYDNSLNWTRLENSSTAKEELLHNLLSIDFLLDDIPVIIVNEEEAWRIRCGQQVQLGDSSRNFLAVKYDNKLLAIGSSEQGIFKIKRVFNL